MIKQYHMIIEGRVQGVGYRWFTREAARDLDIHGSVRNLPDGNVEIIAQGDEESLVQFMEQLKNGPAFSSVLNITLNEKNPVDDLTGFTVTHY